MATTRKDHPDRVAMEKNKNTNRMKDSRSKSPSNYEQEKFRNLERNWETRRANPNKYILKSSKKQRKIKE